MLPTPIVTLNVAKLDVGHRIGIDRKIVVGAAVLTAQMDGPLVRFTLDRCILRPSDTADDFLSWLDRHLTRQGVTITGYRLADMASLLDRLPAAEWSPSLRALSGCGQQQVLDLSASVDGTALTFPEACELSQILCAPVDPDRRFAAWMRSDVGYIEQDAQLDVLAAFRLVLQRLPGLSSAGQAIADTIGGHFAAWLDEADHAVARLHLADLLSVTN